MIRDLFEDQELSPLQKEYREYFQALLVKYDAKSPAEMDEETMKNFFNDVRSGWTKGKGAKKVNEADIRDFNAKPEDRYEDQYDKFEDFMKRITKKIKKHKANFLKNNTDWGYVGDLEYANGKLKEIAANFV